MKTAQAQITLLVPEGRPGAGLLAINHFGGTGWAARAVYSCAGAGRAGWIERL